MKQKKILAGFIALMSLACFGCSGYVQPPCYTINTSYSYRVVPAHHIFLSYEVTISMTVDYEKEFFQWSCLVDSKEYENEIEEYFYFHFHYYDDINLSNSDEFTYTDENGENIVFSYYENKSTKNTYYYFTGSKTITISYKDASAEVKEAIATKLYSLCCSGDGWENMDYMIHHDSSEETDS